MKQLTKLEDLQWAKKTLPVYTLWDSFSEYHFLVDRWIKKVNAELKNNHSDLNDKKSILRKNKYDGENKASNSKRLKNKKGKEKEDNMIIEGKNFLIA